MALIVEDGTGLPDADSYISLIDADAYAVNYGLTAWNAEADNTAKEVALRKATQNIDFREYVSQKLQETQSLEFPRLDPDVAFPEKVKFATVELADLVIQGIDLNASPEVIKKISQQVGQGAVSESKEFEAPKIEDQTKSAFLLLSDWLVSDPNSGISFSTILRS